MATFSSSRPRVTVRKDFLPYLEKLAVTLGSNDLGYVVNWVIQNHILGEQSQSATQTSKRTRDIEVNPLASSDSTVPKAQATLYNKDVDDIEDDLMKEFCEMLAPDDVVKNESAAVSGKD